MRIFALSDIHIDYDVNAKWIANLSCDDYQDDVLILAGDVTDARPLLDWCLSTLVESSGAWMQVFRERGISVIPVLGWYDYSFGEPSEELKSIWMDYRACR